MEFVYLYGGMFTLFCLHILSYNIHIEWSKGSVRPGVSCNVIIFMFST